MKLCGLKWASLALVALAATPAAADTMLKVLTGKWVKVFAVDVERLLGRSIRIDAASVVSGGLGRTFREAVVILNPTPQLARGSTAFSVRSVDCSGGRVVNLQWRVIGPTGAPLGASTVAGPVTRFDWNSEDGKVLKYVCMGVLPR